MNYRLKNLVPIYKRLKMMSNYLQWNKKKDVDKVIDALREGSAVVGTSDTVLGLFADTTYEGFLRLNSLKGRFEKPYLVLLNAQDQAYSFVDRVYLLQIENLLSHCWPGPLTVVLPAKKDVPSYMKSKEGTIALRVPNHDGLLYLLSHFNGVFSTSANRAGKIVPQLPDFIDQYILENVPYCIVDNHVSTVPSTIIQWSEGSMKLLREGAYRVSELEKVLQCKIEDNVKKSRS